MHTEDKPILLNATIDDDHDNNRDDKEKKEDNIDRCMALSHPFCQLCLLLSSSIRIFTDIGGRETGEIRSRHHTASGTENKVLISLTMLVVSTSYL
jgi:hypothetical protein